MVWNEGPLMNESIDGSRLGPGLAIERWKDGNSTNVACCINIFAHYKHDFEAMHNIKQLE